MSETQQLIKDLELLTLRKLGTRLQGHPSRGMLPGVEASTGSLGQGLSMGLGIALAGNLDQRDYRVYVLLGDGESEEEQVWEAAMAAAHYRADNLTAVLDYNDLQISHCHVDLKISLATSVLQTPPANERTKKHLATEMLCVNKFRTMFMRKSCISSLDRDANYS